MRRNFTLILISVLFTFSAQAQSGTSDLFKGLPSDFNKFLNAYLDPLFKGFSNGVNGGYANTAKALGPLRFCVRVSLSGSIVPQRDRSFDINSLGLSSNIKPTDPNQTIAPTFAGSTDQGPSVTYSDPAHVNDPLYPKYKFNLPAGVLQIIPAPQVQLTVGIFANTEASLRFIPETKLNNDIGSIGMFGFNVKHDIAQDFGRASHLIPFDLALSVGYTRFNHYLPLNVKPQNGNVSGSTDFSNQRIESHFSGVNIQALISKKLLFFTPFAAVGYSATQSSVAALGNFPFLSGVDALGQPKYTTYADPITVTGTGNNSGMHADAGFQLSLLFFKLYASYSFASYQSVNGGIGLGF